MAIKRPIVYAWFGAGGEAYLQALRVFDRRYGLSVGVRVNPDLSRQAGGMQRGRAAGPLAKKAWYYHAHLAIITKTPPTPKLCKSASPMTQSTASLLGNALGQ
ncbi:hypothetical protein JANAI62_35750 [Jannaschia pagri]|uniref:Uncharacterized protein n=1 Tax=Jannaschia pagri TaxID=2829797 RepID=A0ABQ4NRA5_9RHOB|nr:hypothetical protein JANAI61_35990 [Jannaschia sp. AI_61]GIT96952.1 hypothetical protein JANAI62_35750 [Jannaschia sp. AI_62]